MKEKQKARLTNGINVKLLKFMIQKTKRSIDNKNEIMTIGNQHSREVKIIFLIHLQLETPYQIGIH